MGRTPKPQPQRRPNPLTRIKPIRQPTPLAQQAIQGAAKAKRACPNKTCENPKIEDGVCQNCGTIIDESNIVAEVQFGENSSGAAVVQGSFVSADQGGAKSLGPAFRRAGGSEDREKTIREGKKLMVGYAAQHQIPESVVNSGMQIFKLATMSNFIQGRRMGMVAAVCLYTAARKEKPCRVMLIDFADSCGVNVFKLGHCFKALHEKITVSADGIMPVLPEDLIYRFAAKLEFGNETHKVAETAVRMVQRMSMDWMVMGRRPSGVCGACLILAARMHNFRRTTTEVVYIVKVTTATIQKRLEEFKYTPSSLLTVEEFLKNSFLESSHDPPSFYEKTEEFQAKKKTRKRKRAADDDGEDGEGEETVRESTTAGSVPPDVNPVVEYRKDADGFTIPAAPVREIPIDPSLLEESLAHLEALAAEHGEPIIEDVEDPAAIVRKQLKPRRGGLVDEEWEHDEQILEQQISEIINDPHTIEHANAFATAEQRARAHALSAHASTPQRDIPMNEEVDDSEFAGDPEVEGCLLTDEESAIKEQIWVNANKDWLREQQQKIFRAKLAAMGPPKATRKRKKKPRIGEGQTEAAESAADAAEAVMKSRAWSKRINYDAVRSLFEGPRSGLGSAATSRITSRAGSLAPSGTEGSVSGSRAGSVPRSNVGSVAGSNVGSVAGSDAGSVIDPDEVRFMDGDTAGDADDNWEEEYEADDY